MTGLARSQVHAVPQPRPDRDQRREPERPRRDDRGREHRDELAAREGSRAVEGVCNGSGRRRGRHGVSSWSPRPPGRRADPAPSERRLWPHAAGDPRRRSGGSARGPRRSGRAPCAAGPGQRRPRARTASGCASRRHGAGPAPSETARAGCGRPRVVARCARSDDGGRVGEPASGGRRAARGRRAGAAAAAAREAPRAAPRRGVRPECRSAAGRARPALERRGRWGARRGRGERDREVPRGRR